jgi:Helix-turn-helix
MTLSDRFLLVLRVLGAKYLTEDLRRDLGIPHKMVLTKWRKGKLPDSGMIKAVARWAGDRLKLPGLTGWVINGTGDHEAALRALIPSSPLLLLRESYGLTQYDAAKLIGISRATLIHWEKTFTLAEGEAWDRASAAYAAAERNRR